MDVVWPNRFKLNRFETGLNASVNGLLEVESGSHWGQTSLFSAHTTSTKAPTVTTQLSLALQQVLRFHTW